MVGLAGLVGMDGDYKFEQSYDTELAPVLVYDNDVVETEQTVSFVFV
ncbi:hypothetical protein L3i20_v238440 [Paenibacillus sp. L3-i20]|nr:hypothetical protein L3i20_v238440 [Paenibacillus sp. L3-i20]